MKEEEEDSKVQKDIKEIVLLMFDIISKICFILLLYFWKSFHLIFGWGKIRFTLFYLVVVGKEVSLFVMDGIKGYLSL